MIVFCCVLPASNKARDDDDIKPSDAAAAAGHRSLNALSLMCEDHQSRS